MGREVRRVPANWEHPVDERGRYIPLYDGCIFANAAKRWDEENAAWERGEFPEYASEENKHLPFSEWEGERPRAEEYMPAWPDEERTHFQMYEDTSEGTPISPVMETPEALARWLSDNGASSFASMTATYEQWLSVCRGGWAPSMVMTFSDAGAVMRSGVEAMAKTSEDS